MVLRRPARAESRTSDVEETGSDSVSVIIPTRERAELIRPTLESVLLQTRPVEEILLVDDGSTGESAEKLDALAAQHERVEVLHRPEQRGPAAARNHGLERARGSHLLFLDDDDLIHPRMCEDGLEVLGRSADADAVLFLYECFFTPADFGVTESVARIFDYRQLSAHPLDRAGHGNPVPASFLADRSPSSFLRFLIPIHSCLVRRAAIGDSRFPEALRQGEDTYFWIALAAGGCRFVHDPRVYAFIRRHPGNVTRSRSDYLRDIQACYEALLEDGLLTDRRDAYLAHLKLLSFKARTGDRRWLEHLGHVIRAPHLLVEEIAFWISNLRKRRRLLAYYFAT